MPNELTNEQRERARQLYRRMTDALRDAPTGMLASTKPPVERPKKAVLRAAQVLVGGVDRGSVSRVAETIQRLVAQVAALQGDGDEEAASPPVAPTRPAAR